jgi:hypothetical protein
LKAALDLGAETRMIKLNDLRFRNCEGYYSKAAQACTWPCSITQMDANDASFADYNAIYGSLGAGIGMMMWMWISAIVILFGAQLNSEIEHQTARDSTVEGDKRRSWRILSAKPDSAATRSPRWTRSMPSRPLRPAQIKFHVSEPKQN